MYEFYRSVESMQRKKRRHINIISPSEIGKVHMRQFRVESQNFCAWVNFRNLTNPYTL